MSENLPPKLFTRRLSADETCLQPFIMGLTVLLFAHTAMLDTLTQATHIVRPLMRVDIAVLREVASLM
jgi:hypothetical protein